MHGRACVHCLYVSAACVSCRMREPVRSTAFSTGYSGKAVTGVLLQTSLLLQHVCALVGRGVASFPSRVYAV